MSVDLKSGITVYYDKFNGNVLMEKPVISNFSKGGILADEMGLGKTVEVLACILANSKLLERTNTDAQPIIEYQRKKTYVAKDESINNAKIYVGRVEKHKVPEKWTKKQKSANYIALEKWYNETLSELSTLRPKNNGENSSFVQCICGDNSDNDLVECTNCKKYQHKSCFGFIRSCKEYFCPQCWIEKPLVDSDGTLIVTPGSLRMQWCKEISKHIKGNLKVLVYKGNTVSPIYPTNLKKYDLVITTYSVLQNELRLTENLQVRYDEIF